MTTDTTSNDKLSFTLKDKALRWLRSPAFCAELEALDPCALLILKTVAGLDDNALALAKSESLYQQITMRGDARRYASVMSGVATTEEQDHARTALRTARGEGAATSG